MAFRLSLAVAICFLSVATATVGPLRVEVELRRLNNSQALLANGEQCDMTSACDMRVKGYLDTDEPLALWPGGKPIEKWTKVFEKDNDNTPIVNKIVSRDVCTEDVTRANLRLNVVDVDSLSKNDLVEQIECMVPIETVAESMARATWSTERSCKSQFHPREIRLSYRYRVFQIQTKECGRPPTRDASTTV